MPNELKLYAVTDTKKFVKGVTNSGAMTLPTFSQGDSLAIRALILEVHQAGGFLTPYTVVTEQMSVRCGVVLPSSTVPTLYSVGTLAFDGTQAYYGLLDMNTSSVATLLGTSLSANAYFELEATGSSARTTWQAPCVVVADGLKQGTPVDLTGTDMFYTSAEADARYLYKNNSTELSATTVITRSGDAQTFNFGVQSGGWADNDDTVATKGYVDASTASVLTSGGTFTTPIFTDGGVPVGPNEVVGRNWVLENGGNIVAGAGITKTGQTVAADFGVTPGKVARGEHWHYTGTLVESGAGLYHTSARVLNTIVSTIDVSGTVAAVNEFDNVVGALGKLEATKMSVAGGVFTGNVTLPGATTFSPSVEALGNGKSRYDANLSQFVDSLYTLEVYRPGVIVKSYSTKSTTATTSEQSLVPTSLKGSLTLAGGFFAVGRVLRLRMAGFMSTIDPTPGTLTLRIKLDGSEISSATFTPAAAQANDYFRLEGDFVLTTAGSTGQLIGQTFADMTDQTVSLTMTTATTLDCNAQHVFSVTAQWSTADNSNTLSITNLTLEVL